MVGRCNKEEGDDQQRLEQLRQEQLRQEELRQEQLRQEQLLFSFHSIREYDHSR